MQQQKIMTEPLRHRSNQFTMFPILAVTFLCFFVQNCTAQSSNAVTLGNEPRLDRFLKLLDSAAISPSIGLTVFAPTEEAFARFEESDPARWAKYSSQPEFFVHLRDLLMWHFVTEDDYTISNIFDGSREAMETLTGNLTIDQRFKKIDNLEFESFVETDIPTSEGIVHVINDVIVPPYLGENMIAQLLDDRSYVFAYSNMANLALYVGLDERINAVYEHGLTFLVPTNRRFNRAELDIPKMLTPEMFNFTRDFILCHMVAHNYHEAQVFAINEESDEDQFLVLTELGTHMWVTTTEDKLRFQSVEILLADQPSNNGIFHVMDNPLAPPFASDFAMFTPIATNIDTSDCNRFFTQCILNSQDIAAIFNTTLSVFCPTREAFSFFNNEDFNRLLEPIWYRHSCEFLLNHITQPAMTRAEFAAMAPSHVTMLNGATYQLRKSGDRPRIKNGDEEGRSEFGDLIALDGYLHTLDTVITPTAVSRSIYDQSNENPDFSLLVENIDFVDLTDLVDRDLPLTLLAPDNNAWRRVEFGTLEGGEIIKRHILRGLFFCDVLANLTSISAVNSVVHGIEVRGENSDRVWVGGAYIYKCDILARNGVLHHIDRVIGMDYETVPPTISPAPTITPQPTISVEPTSAPVPLFAEEPESGAVPIYLPPVALPTPHVNQSAPGSQGGSTPGASSAVSTLTGLASVTLFAFMGLLALFIEAN